MLSDNDWMNDKNLIDNLTNYVPYVKYGKVIKVYDGDTITIAAKPYDNYPPHKFHVRLAGIDTPELHSHDELEKNLALKAKLALHDLVYNKCVELKNTCCEKYGRILADVYFNNVHINDLMIKNGYAKVYHGDKKESFL